MKITKTVEIPDELVLRMIIAGWISESEAFNPMIDTLLIRGDCTESFDEILKELDKIYGYKELDTPDFFYKIFQIVGVDPFKHFNEEDGRKLIDKLFDKNGSENN